MISNDLGKHFECYKLSNNTMAYLLKCCVKSYSLYSKRTFTQYYYKNKYNKKSERKGNVCRKKNTYLPPTPQTLDWNSQNTNISFYEHFMK